MAGLRRWPGTVTNSTKALWIVRLAQLYSDRMDTTRIIKELQAERDQLDLLIIAFERYAATAGGKKRRGRPPKWMSKDRQAQSA